MLKFKQLLWMRTGIISLIVILFGSAMVVAYPRSVKSANADNWMTAQEFTFEFHTNQNYDQFHEAKCTYQDVQLQPEHFQLVFEGYLVPECVYDMGDWKYALTEQHFDGRFMYNSDVKSFVFSTGDDRRMYKINELTDHIVPTYIPQSKSIVKRTGSGMDGAYGIKIYKNIFDRLTPNDDKSYSADLAEPDFIFERSDGFVQPIGKFYPSSNGKWLIFEAINVGLVRLNLDTYEMKRFAPATELRTVGYNQLTRFDISDDGSKVVAAGQGLPFNMYSINESCGDTNFTFHLNTLIPLVNPCPVRSFDAEIEKMQLGLGNISEIDLRSDTDEMQIVANTGKRNSPYPSGRYIVRPKNNLVDFRLDYLALGDSYSSGEGDTQVVDGKKFYLAGTDINGDAQTPREKCHISSRSYPFLLKQAMGIDDRDMKSVACSGAEAGKDYIESNNYRGQNDSGVPRLVNLFPDELKMYQDDARNSFISGRVQQLEFISKYKPRAVTITGSGNDVGFSGVIRSCLMGLAACSDAQSPEGRARIGQEIIRQHDQLFKLYQSIQIASPDTKIYALGYPQFINDQSFFCAPNVQLDSVERKLIAESVSFLNNIIEDAAINAGVKYIDIENSLQGHRLCEAGKSYITGIAMAGKSENQESFHPNHEGHQAISKAVLQSLGNETLLNYTIHTDLLDLENKISTETPMYFKDALTYVNKKYQRSQLTQNDTVQKSNTFNIGVDNMHPGSRVDVEVHSNPTSLGSYIVDEQGELSVDVALPSDILPGFHTLHVIGQTFSGEEIDMWQSIEIQGVAEDIDEDGISDELDLCVYVSVAGVDMDNDTIDDGCDSVIDGYSSTQPDSKLVAVVGSTVSESNTQSGNTIANAIYVDQNDSAVHNRVAKIFSLSDAPNHISNSDNRVDINMITLVISGGMCILLLILVLTRYSTYKDM